MFCSFFRRHQNFPVTCVAVPFFLTAPNFSIHVCCSSFFSNGTKIFQSRVLQFLFFRRLQNFPVTCAAVPFFPTAPKFSIHVFCSFFRRHQNFPVTCAAVFFRPHQNFPFTCSAVLVFPTAPKFSSHVYCSSFFSDRTKIFQPRVASYKLADISTTCDVDVVLFFLFMTTVAAM